MRFWIGLELSIEGVAGEGKGVEGSGADGLGVLAHIAPRLFVCWSSDYGWRDDGMGYAHGAVNMA